MEQTTSTPTTATPQPTDPQPSPSPLSPAPPSIPLLPQLSSASPSSSSFASSANPNPKPPTSQSQPSLQNSQSRPPFNRPSWAQQQPHPHFSHFSSSPSPSPVPPFSSSAPPSISSLPLPQRGGMAIGVPATPPPNFSSMNPLPPPPFGPQFGALARNSVNMPDSGSNSSNSQPIQGMQGMGMMGSLGSSLPMRPGGVPAQHLQRPLQSSPRPQTSPNNQSPATQTFQGHSLLRVPSVGSPGSSLPNASQSSQPHNQPWLPSGSQGKPPLPPPSYRPQLNAQSLQQRPHIPQQQHLPMTNAQQQQQTSSGQQSQSTLSHQPQEHYGQQFPPSRIQQSLPHQQQITRDQGLGSQKSSYQTIVQPSAILTVSPSATAIAEHDESCNRILSKRSIQELVTQIDPSETLDPEVEDILVDIAEEFVDSITTFGCSLAKHRKSNTLEAKDILLYLERNWNMTLPGFSGDEIKGYRRSSAIDIHRERFAAIKRSMVATETSNTKTSAGQAGGNAKGHSKAPANIIGKH